MYKYLIFLIVLFCHTTILFSAEYFEAERLEVNFNGVCSNSNVVIAYGNGGIILISGDKGQNWRQRKIFDDSVIIRKILPFKKGFLGLTNNNLIFTLNENAGNLSYWPAKVNFPLIDFAVNSDMIYILSKSYIYEMNEDSEIIKTEKIQEIPKPNSIHFFKGKLYLSTDSSTIYSYNIEDNYSLIEHNISSYGKWSNYFRNDADYLYVVFSGLIYKTTDGKKWDKVSQSSANYCYILNKGEIYDIGIGYNMNWYVSWPEYRKLGSDMKFQRKNIDTIGRHAFFSYLTACYIDENTIVAAGNNKTIYVSTDNGFSWDLKSNFKIDNIEPNSTIWLNDQTWYYANKNIVYRTTDAGITWKPQIFTDSRMKYFGNSNFLYIDETGRGFLCSSNFGTYGDSAKDMNFLYTIDSGNTFKWKYIDEINLGIPKMQSPVIKLPEGYRIVLTPSSWVTHLQSTMSLDFDSNFNLVDTFLLDSIIVLDFRNYNSGYISAFAVENRYPAGYGNFDSTKYWIMHSIDYGKTWLKDIRCIADTLRNLMPTGWQDNYIFLLRNITLFDTVKLQYTYAYSFLYCLDSDKGAYNLMYMDTTVNNTALFYYNNKIYIKNYKGDILCSSNFMYNSPAWDSVYFSINELPKIDKYFIPPGDSCIYALGYYAYGKPSMYKLKQMEKTDVENNSEEAIDYIYATKPAPSPAKSLVRISIYEISEEDITTARISIFDYIGNKISDGKDIERFAETFYKGDIVWDCSSVNPGVYFINFDFGTVRTTVPVVVVR